MMVPIYVYLDERGVAIHEERAYHQSPDGKHVYVELSEPMDDTSERWHECVAILSRFLATAREGQASSLPPA